eukprot:TRINITY_DN952_c0_g1_i1.p1 TRINITY_DN952_c0_g1~~TRINITY_DN952_c0_g1_i1.p1  ORF type:complete len:719 (-),score=301.09 TRINITY_DN952_c0_g1_i1:156-2312(-)
MDYAAAVKKLAGSGDALPRPVIQKPKEVNRVAQQPAPQQNQPASPVVKRNIDKDSLPPSYFSLLPNNFIKDLIAHLGPEAVSMLANTNHFGNIVFGSREVWNKFKLKNLSLTPLSVRIAVQIPQQSKDADDKNGEEQTDDQAGNENENNDEQSEGRYTTVKELLQREARLKTLADRLLSEVDKQGKALKLNGGFRFYQKGQNQSTPLGIECTQLGHVSKWLEAVADMFKDKQRVQLPVNDKEEITLQRLGRAGRILKAILPGDKPAVYFTFEDFAAGVYQQGLNLSKLFDKVDETIAARAKRFPDQAAFQDNLKNLREKFNKKALDAALNETRSWFTKSTTAYTQLAERIKGSEEKKKKVATRIKAEYKDMHTFINIPAVKEYFPAQDESEPEPEPAPVVAAAPENGKAAEPAEKKDAKKNKKGKKEQPAQGDQVQKKVTPKAAPKETGPDDFAEDPRNVRLQRKRDLLNESRDSQEGKPEATKPKEAKAAAPTPAPAANSAAKAFTDKNFFDIIVNKSEKDVEKMLQEPAEKPAAAKPKPKPKQQDKPKPVEAPKPVTSAPQPTTTVAPAAAKKQATQQPPKENKDKQQQQPKEKKQVQQPPKEKQQPKEKKEKQPQPPKEKKVTVVEPTPAPQPPKEKKPKKQAAEPTRKPAAPAQLDKDTQSKLKKLAAKNKAAKGGLPQQLQELLDNPKQLAIGAAAAILALVLYYFMFNSNKQ